MVFFDKWCSDNSEVVNGHNLKILSSLDDNSADRCSLVAAVLPRHYASSEHIARVFETFGKEAAAELVRMRLPRSRKIRSGDLGEILATEYIDECTIYIAPIKRLRWKDHREMAMRGDDVIGVAPPEGDAPLRLLKSEVKSRATLSSGVVAQAREALEKENGLPSPHALGFLSARLHETGQSELADQIDLAQLKDGIAPEQVQHLLFAFSGNAPADLLRVDLQEYAGAISQNSTGLMVPGHQDFIAAVYEVAGAGDDA